MCQLTPPPAHPPCTPSSSPLQPFERHFGCIPDVRDVIHQTVPSRRQLYKHGSDVCLIFLDVPSLSQVLAIILQHWRQVLRLETFVFCLKCIFFLSYIIMV